MKSNEEILNDLGKLIVNNVVDLNYETIQKIIFDGTPNPIKKRYFEAFDKLDDNSKNLVKEFILKNSHTLIFNFLNIFEEHECFKLIYEENGKQINLVEISEMLKAEPIIENGWISRFSKYVKENEII